MQGTQSVENTGRVAMRSRRVGAMVCLVAGLLAASYAAPALAGHPANETHPAPLDASIIRGLAGAGLTPNSTGLDAPMGDSSASVPVDVAAGATGDPPLRVYVLVVDGLLPTQVGLQTPTLHKLKTEGTWYQQARAVAPAETLPNHAAMATGVTPARNGIIANQFFRAQIKREYMQYPEFWDADTITTRLERAYRGAIDTATILSKEYLYGLFRGEHEGHGDAVAQREADFHWDPRSQPAYVEAPSSHALDVGTMDALLGWIRAHGGSPRPQFAFVNLGDVDRAGHADEEGIAPAAADRAASGDDELTSLHTAPFQQAAIEDTDTQIGRLVTELQNGGTWDESVLIVLSDHGMDWGPQNQVMPTLATVNAAGYSSGFEGGNSLSAAEYWSVGGGGSELIYVYRERDIDPIARILCGTNGVAVIATREPLTGTDATKCQTTTLDELGLDHRYSPEIQVFAEPGWHSEPEGASTNPLPGNHGHAVTQHSALFVAGGHPALKSTSSVAGPRVYQRGRVSPPIGPGVLSVAPTVAGLFGIGSPAGGYDGAPLTEAFDPGVVDLNSSDPVHTPAAGGGEDAAQDDAADGKPYLAVGSRVTSASLTAVTYSSFVANRGSGRAEDVILTNPVPTRTTFASSERPPLDAGTCSAGAPANTTCRWAIGDLAPGASATVEVTHNFAATGSPQNTVTAQLGGAAPVSGDPKDTDGSLDRVVTVVEDTHVDDDAASNQNYGGCARLEVGRGNAVTSFVEADDVFFQEWGDKSDHVQVGTLWAAELQATVNSVTSAPVDVGAHRIISADWTEGTGTCPGGGAGTGRDARTGAEPVSEPAAVATVPVNSAGDKVSWDVRTALDTRRERGAFSGFELRLTQAAAAVPDRSVAFHSSGASTASTRAQLVTVSTPIERATCVDVDPETMTRRSDTEQRLRAYATDGQRLTDSHGQDACTGVPVPNAPIGWEFERVTADTPDAYISSLAGERTEREMGSTGDVAPNRGSTRTGPTGRTFIDIGLGDPYYQERNFGTTRMAAIALTTHDGYYGPPLDTSQGVCEPGNCGVVLAGNGEGANEDDIVTTWTPVARPADTGTPDPPVQPGGGGTSVSGGGAPGAGTPGTGTAHHAGSCARATGFRGAAVRSLGTGLRFAFTPRFGRPAMRVELFEQTIGRFVGGRRRIDLGSSRRGLAWNGLARGLHDGYWSARLQVRSPSGVLDTRIIGLRRQRGRWTVLPTYYRSTPCALLSYASLARPVFGGSHQRSLWLGFTLRDRARVGITVSRGGRIVRLVSLGTRRPGTHRLVVPARHFRGGDHVVTLTVTRAGRTTRHRLYTRRL